MKQYDLYIFDVDGTIAERDTTDLLPGVAEWFAGNQTAVAFATNQGGVGLRYWMETAEFGEPEKYPTETDVWQRLDSIQENIGRPDILKLASFAYQSKSSGKWSPTPNCNDRFDALCWHPSWRKPDMGMIAFSQANFQIFKSAVMVGDSEEDEAAAHAAGIDFIHADDFFGRN